MKRNQPDAYASGCVDLTNEFLSPSWQLPRNLGIERDVADGAEHVLDRRDEGLLEAVHFAEEVTVVHRIDRISEQPSISFQKEMAGTLSVNQPIVPNDVVVFAEQCPFLVVGELPHITELRAADHPRGVSLSSNV